MRFRYLLVFALVLLVALAASGATVNINITDDNCSTFTTSGSGGTVSVTCNGSVTTTTTGSTTTTTLPQPGPFTGACPGFPSTATLNMAAYFKPNSSGGGNQRLNTAGLTSGEVVASFNTGTGTGGGRLAFGEFSANVVPRLVKISKTPCDLTVAPLVTAYGSNSTIYFMVNQTYPGYPTLDANTWYYVSLANVNPDTGVTTCDSTAGPCDVFMELKRP